MSAIGGIGPGTVLPLALATGRPWMHGHPLKSDLAAWILVNAPSQGPLAQSSLDGQSLALPGGDTDLSLSSRLGVTDIAYRTSLQTAPILSHSSCHGPCGCFSYGIAFALIRAHSQNPNDVFVSDTARANAQSEAKEASLKLCKQKAWKGCLAQGLCYCNAVPTTRLVAEVDVPKGQQGKAAAELADKYDHGTASGADKKAWGNKANRLEYDDDTKDMYRWADTVVICVALTVAEGHCVPFRFGFS